MTHRNYNLTRSPTTAMKTFFVVDVEWLVGRAQHSNGRIRNDCITIVEKRIQLESEARGGECSKRMCITPTGNGDGGDGCDVTVLVGTFAHGVRCSFFVSRHESTDESCAVDERQRRNAHSVVCSKIYQRVNVCVCVDRGCVCALAMLWWA